MYLSIQFSYLFWSCINFQQIVSRWPAPKYVLRQSVSACNNIDGFGKDGEILREHTRHHKSKKEKKKRTKLNVCFHFDI